MAEDRAEDAELAMLALEESNLAKGVKWLRDGQAALDYLLNTDASGVDASECVRLILLDINMPKVGGLEVLKQLRGNEKTNLIPIVVLTTSSYDDDIVKAFELGANSYVAKPVDFTEFSNRVKEIAKYWLTINQVPSS